MYLHNHNDYLSYYHNQSSKPNLNVYASPYTPHPYQMYANPYITYCVPLPNNTPISSSAVTPSTTQQGTANVNQVQFTNPGALQQ